jgi:hypothetical protein
MIRSLELPKLPKIFNIPPSIQKYLKPMLMASVGLHIFVLLAPLPADQLNQKSHRPKTVRLTPRSTVRKKAKTTIPKPPPPVQALPKVRIAALSNKGLVIPGPPKKRAPALTPSPKGKPNSEKKQAEKPQSGKPRAQPSPPSPPQEKKATKLPSNPPGGGSAGLEDFLQNIIANLSDNTDVGPDLFSSPTAFFPNYKQLEPNAPPAPDIPEKSDGAIEDTRIIKSKTPQQVYENLLPSLSQNSYVPTPIPAGYGGGQLYKIDGGKSPVYINLVPTTNGKDTVVVTWLTDPSS